MNVRSPSRIREEAQRLRLRWSCESCAHFDPDEECCVHGYPTTEHREATLETQTEIVFCKEFELS